MTSPGGRRPRAWLFAAAALAAPAAAAGQGAVTASGRVLRVTETDSVPVPGALVVLHRVGRDRQGPIDSQRTGGAGRFQFRYRADTTAVFLLSSGFAGIEYFSTPLHLDPSLPDSGIILLVSDTSSTTPIEVLSRHLVVSRPSPDGTRPALEIVVLGNPASVTRVAGDSAHPTWRMSLPRGALAPQMGQGDVSADAVVFRNDSLLLFAPIAPGQKEVVFGYTLPAGAGRTRFAVADSTASFTLLLEERDRPVSGGGLVAADTQAIEGRVFGRWSGSAAAGSDVIVGFAGAGPGRWLLPLLVGAVGCALLLVMVRVLRRPATAAAPAASPLLDQLARLDARYAGRAGEVSGEEWGRYQAERAALKAALESELAGKQGAP